MYKAHGLDTAQALSYLGGTRLAKARCLKVEQARDDLEIVARLVVDFLDKSIPVRQRGSQIGRTFIDLSLQRAGQFVELLIAFRQTARRNLQLFKGDTELFFGIRRFGPACGETDFQ